MESSLSRDQLHLQDSFINPVTIFILEMDLASETNWELYGSLSIDGQLMDQRLNFLIIHPLMLLVRDKITSDPNRVSFSCFSQPKDLP